MLSFKDRHIRFILGQHHHFQIRNNQSSMIKGSDNISKKAISNLKRQYPINRYNEFSHELHISQSMIDLPVTSK